MTSPKVLKATPVLSETQGHTQGWAQTDVHQMIPNNDEL